MALLLHMGNVVPLHIFNSGYYSYMERRFIFPQIRKKNPLWRLVLCNGLFYNYVHYVSIWFSAKLRLFSLWLESSMAAHPVSDRALCPTVQEQQLYKGPARLETGRNRLEALSSTSRFQHVEKDFYFSDGVHAWWLQSRVHWGQNECLCNNEIAKGDRFFFCWSQTGEGRLDCVVFLADGGVALAALSSCHSECRGPARACWFYLLTLNALPLILLWFCFLPVWHWGPGGWYTAVYSHTQRWLLYLGGKSADGFSLPSCWISVPKLFYTWCMSGWSEHLTSVQVHPDAWIFILSLKSEQVVVSIYCLRRCHYVHMWWE